MDSRTGTEVFKKQTKESATNVPSLNTLLPNFCKEKNWVKNDIQIYLKSHSSAVPCVIL